MKRLAVALAMVLACTSVQAEEVLAGLMVNGKPVEAGTVHKDEDGHLLLSVDTWAGLGLDLDLGGKSGLVSARELGIEVKFDEGEQAYNLIVPLSRFRAQQLRSRQVRVTEVAEQPRGVFVNYDLAVRHEQGRPLRASLGHEARIGVGPGTLITTGQANSQGQGVTYVRGLSTWHHDFLAKGVALQLGDVFTARSTLGPSVNLGGVRVSSDRQLRRDERFLPVPVLGGVVQDTSVADLFLNGHKQGQYAIDKGRWELDQYPVQPGSNQIRAVVRDDFGREQIIEDRFYYSPDNLPPGTMEWDVSAGLVRQPGDRYATPAAVANIERGVTRHWTGSAQLQLAQDGRNLQLGSRIVLGTKGALSLDLAASEGPEGRGHAAAVAYDYRANDWSVRASHSRYSDDYWTLAQARDDASLFSSSRLASTSTLALSIAPRGKPWSATVAGVQAAYQDGRQQQRVSGAARWQAGANDFGLGASFGDDRQIFATWSRRLGTKQVSATARAAPEIQAQASVSGSTTLAGHATSFVAGVSHDQRGTIVGGQAQVRLPKGDLSIAGQVGQKGRVLDARFRGSVWVGEGGVMAQRPSPASFLLVQVPGQKGVPVQGPNGSHGTTNARGWALLSNLQPLQRQRVQMDTSELPMTVSIESNRLPVSLGRRAGGKLAFTVQSERIVELRLTHQGQPVDAAHAATDQEQVVVGQGGVAFLMQAAPGQEVQVDMGARGQCRAQLPKTLEDTIALDCR